jgi:hypothetical protein
MKNAFSCAAWIVLPSMIAAVLCAAPASSPKTFTFDGDQIGSPPAGFEFAPNRPGSCG